MFEKNFRNTAVKQKFFLAATFFIFEGMKDCQIYRIGYFMNLLYCKRPVKTTWLVFGVSSSACCVTFFGFLAWLSWFLQTCTNKELCAICRCIVFLIVPARSYLTSFAENWCVQISFDKQLHIIFVADPL